MQGVVLADTPDLHSTTPFQGELSYGAEVDGSLDSAERRKNAFRQHGSRMTMDSLKLLVNECAEKEKDKSGAAKCEADIPDSPLSGQRRDGGDRD